MVKDNLSIKEHFDFLGLIKEIIKYGYQFSQAP